MIFIFFDFAEVKVKNRGRKRRFIKPQQTLSLLVSIRGSNLKAFTLTQAATYLMVSRHTLGRMSLDGRLPADAVNSSGRKRWNKETLDAYRLGNTRAGAVALVECSALPEMAVAVTPGQTLMGYRCVVSPLTSSNRAEALVELASFLVEKKPAALALPASNHAAHAVQTVIDICCNSGIAVLLLP